MEFPLIVLLCIALAWSAHSAWTYKKDERMLRRIIQATPIPIFVIGKDHRVICWNQAMEKIGNIKARDVIGTDGHWKAFYPSKRPCVADLIVDGAVDEAPQWYSGEPGKFKMVAGTLEAVFINSRRGQWFRCTAAAIRGERGEIIGAIETTEDVTEEKLADEELMRMKKHESLGAFAGGVAQDFDSLMSAVLRNIFLAKLTAADEDKLVEEGLATAEKAGLQAKQLAHQLITFAKGGYAMRKTESLIPLLREAVETAGSPPGIRWNLSVPDDLWPVEMDSRQIRQVLENLVRNGLEAMPEGGTLDVAAECITIGERNIHNLKQGPYVTVSIRDSGAGFRREDLSKIFDPYFTATGDRKGAGLGLSICYSILKHHDGTIAVESEPGEGTIFRLFLPAVPGGSRDTGTVENGAGPAQ